MTDINKDLAIAQIISLMTSYSFDTNRRNPEKLVREWRKKYDVNWIHLATIEALYLGRYKAISIEQILHGWSRIGQPNTHFGGDFERVISRKLPQPNFTKKAEGAIENSPKLSKSQSQISQEIDSAPDMAKNKDLPKQDSEYSSSGEKKSSNNSIISTQVTPVPQPKSIPTCDREKAPTQNHNSNNKEDKLSRDSRIVSFQPLPDASDFFQKLKAFARNQIKNKDSENKESN